MSHLLLLLATCGKSCWASSIYRYPPPTAPSDACSTWPHAHIPSHHVMSCASPLWTSSHCPLMDCGRLPGHRLHAPLTSQSTREALPSGCTNLYTHNEDSGFPSTWHSSFLTACQSDESKVVPYFHLRSPMTGEFEQLFVHLSVMVVPSFVNCLFISFLYFFLLGF